MSRPRRLPLYALLLALACSLALTLVTVSPPAIPTDWARLNQNGIYFPLHITYDWPGYAIQVALWLLMIAALGWVVPRGNAGTRQAVSLPVNMLIITLIGFGLRLYTLNHLPLIVDEIGFAAHASDILHGQAVPILAPGHNANPSAYSWLVAGAMALFGQNAFAIRLIPLAFGTMSIPAAYVLGREWFSRRVGLLAALFLATYPAHVFYSRMSLYNIVDPFFAMLALAFMVRGTTLMTPAQRRYLMLAGIMTGIAQYFYHGSRMLPLLMAVYIVLSLRKQYRTQRREGGKAQSFYESLRVFVSLRLCVESFWMLAAFALVALPRYAPMLIGSLPMTGNRETMRLPADLANNTLRAALAWVGQPDVSPFWLSSQPLLLFPALLAFLLGLWACIRRWRDVRSIVLLLAIPLTTIFGGAIWTAAPLYVRYMTAAPMIALLVALGVEKPFFDGLPRRGGSQTRPYTGAILIVLIALQGTYVSLMIHPQEAYAAITPGHWEEDALAKQAASLAPDTAAVLLVSPDFGAKPPDPRTLQMMSIAHYIAAYGERRPVVVNIHDPIALQKQLARLGQRSYMTLEITLP